MLDGVNDSDAHARQLIALVRPAHGEPAPCKFNLIPFNPFTGLPVCCAHPPERVKLCGLAQRGGHRHHHPQNAGTTCAAACGQLAGDIQDRTDVSGRRAKTIRIHAHTAKSMHRLLNKPFLFHPRQAPQLANPGALGDHVVTVGGDAPCAFSP
jgi:23S rRNA (adenine2503-C2)-methyltransferase